MPWDPLDGCITFTAYAQVFCRQACEGTCKRVLLESLRLPRKVTDKNVRACRLLFHFPARSSYKGDLGRDVTLSLLSYPELHRGVTAYVPREDNIGISFCTGKKIYDAIMQAGGVTSAKAMSLVVSLNFKKYEQLLILISYIGGGRGLFH